MKILFLDCSAGISGDMFLSSLLDTGLEQNRLLGELEKLNLAGYEINARPGNSHGITGTKLDVLVREDQPHRHWQDIKNIINNSSLGESIKKRALDIFYNLARAEARVHGTSIDDVHFHEVGAVDSIIDIVGAAAAVEILRPNRIYANTLSLGRGFVNCQHGTLPVPAPATAELVQNMPVRLGPGEGEMVTPTGAAIVKTLVDSFNPPEFKIEHTGYGIGSRDFGMPNTLRAMLGSTDTITRREKVSVLECGIDDINPELLPHLQDTLLHKGALDVYIQDLKMKKGRPGFLVQVICHPANSRIMEETLFQESSTFGIRQREESRAVLSRKETPVSTPYGKIRVKTGLLPDNNRPVQAAPEFEDCREASLRCNIPLKEVYNAALLEFYKENSNQD